MKTSITYGLVAAAAGIVVWLIAGIAGLQYLITEEQIYLTLPFVFWFSILAMRKRKGETNGPFSYMECLKTSLVLGAVAGFILALFNFAYYTLVAQGVVEALARRAMAALPAANKLSPLQRELDIAQAKWLAIVDSSIADVLSVFLYSLFFGAIAGIFMRTKPGNSAKIVRA